MKINFIKVRDHGGNVSEASAFVVGNDQIEEIATTESIDKLFSDTEEQPEPDPEPET